ncbi:MAG TPA: adenylyltransferase/cytidyltransferase family protein [Chthoniobacterales bacterium]|nr:adenylyltransferase/cytidyltransferase family protein [Chthoniobacterales bacterium]
MTTEFPHLIELASSWRKAGARIVLCHGCFDPLHIGHLRHFVAASKFGDRLLVTVTADEHVKKGPRRPLFAQDLRIEMVAAIKYVSAAAINPCESAVETIRQLRPHFFVKGADYQNSENCNPNFLLEAAEVRRIGGKVVFTDELKFSSTEVIQWMGSH